MKIAASLSATLLTFAASACSPPAPAAPPSAPAQTAEPASEQGAILDYAKTLPPLQREGDTLAIPLAGAATHPWRPIRDGVTATPGDSLTVSYTRTRGQPAGAALVIRPGDLAGLDSFTLTLRGTREQTILLNFTQSDGSVWTSPPIRLAPDESRQLTFSIKDITLDPYQNKGRAKDLAFNPAEVYMLTLLDIGGFMALTEPQCEWTVQSMKAVLQ